MRLKLNKTLRAALIAAITTVGFTLPQAEAATMYTQPTFSGSEFHWVNGAWQEGNPSRQANKGPVLIFEDVGTVNISGGIPDTSDYGGIKVSGDSTVTTSLGGWAGYIVVEKGSSLTASYNNDLKSRDLGENEASVYVAGQLKIKDRANLWMTDGNSAQRWLIDEEGFVDLSAVNGVTKNAKRWDMQLNVGAGEPVSLDGYTNRTLGGQITKKFMSTGADLYGNVDSWAVFCEGVELDSSAYTISHNASGMSVTYDAETAIMKMSLTWAGGEGTWVEKGTHWNSAGVVTSFANGDDVLFEGTGNVASLSGAIVVGTLTVAEGGSTTLNISGDTSLAANTTNVQGATLTLSGNGSVDLGSTNFSNGNLVVDGMEYSLGNQSHVMKTLTVKNGGVVTTTHDGSDGAVRGDIIIEAGSTFRVASGHDAFGWGDGYGNSTKNIILGGSEEHVALLDIQGDNSSCTLGSAIQMNGYASIIQKAGKAAFNANGCTITATGTHNNIDRFQIRKGMVITVNGAESTLEVGQMTKHNEGDKVLTKSGDGTLIFTNGGAMSKLVQTAGTTRFDNGSTIDAIEYTGGSLVFAGGTNTVTGTSNVLSNTITVAGGELTLNGTFEIGGNTGEMETTYVGGATEGNGNGFEHVAGSSKVYTKAAEGASVNVEGATFTVGGKDVTSAVVDGVYTTQGSTNFGTFYVKNGEESLTTAINYATGHTVNNVSLANGTTITWDKADTTVGLILADDAQNATVKATAAATLSSISGWTNMLTVSGTEAVSLGSADRTLTGTQKLNVEGTANTGKLILNSATAGLTVAEGATLAVTGNLTPTHGAVEIKGTLTVSGDLDLSNGGASDVKMKVDTTGKVTAAGMWMCGTSALQLLQGGQYSIAGVTITGKANEYDNTLITTANGKYGTNNEAFTITNAIVTTTTGNVTLGNTLVNTDVVVADGTRLTLNTNAASVTVQNGGTFYLNDGKTVTTITVENGGTIAGGVDAKDVTIAAGGTAKFNEGINDTTAGVYIINVSEGAPTVTNNGGTDAKYAGLQDASMTVTAETLMSEAAAPVVVNNGLAVKSIAHEGTGALTLAHVDAVTLEGVYANDGALTLQNITEVSLTEMTIAPEATVAVYQGDVEAANQEGTVTITDTLTAGGGTLLANLTIVAGAEEAFAWDLGGTTMRLGSELTLVTTRGTNLIQLDDATMQAIAGLETGASYELVRNGSEAGLTYTGSGSWDDVFTRSYGGENALALEGDYQVGLLDNGNFGVTKSSNVPEPTTGTLSLLALAALAARRRRK